VVRSRGAVGTNADNAAAESFNASLKRETLQGRKSWSGGREARHAVFRWVTRKHQKETLQHRSDQPDRLRAKIQYVVPDE
jgi:transposase InsO family protein